MRCCMLGERVISVMVRHGERVEHFGVGSDGGTGRIQVYGLEQEATMSGFGEVKRVWNTFTLHFSFSNRAVDYSSRLRLFCLALQ